MQGLASPVASDPADAVPPDYPEGSVNDNWDEETLRNYALSTCANAWGLIYSQLFDGLRCEGGISWQQPLR